MATTDSEHEAVVNEHYQKLYRFALGLARDPDLAADLTQQTFYVYATKGSQIRDRSRTKAWLYTTLHREFIATRRKQTRHPQYEIGMMETELPNIEPDVLRRTDIQLVLAALDRLDDRFREPLVLYHIDDLSYREIADVLDLPIGTVMSRLARGREHLFQQVLRIERSGFDNVVTFPKANNP